MTKKLVTEGFKRFYQKGYDTLASQGLVTKRVVSAYGVPTISGREAAQPKGGKFTPDPNNYSHLPRQVAYKKWEAERQEREAKEKARKDDASSRGR